MDIEQFYLRYINNIYRYLYSLCKNQTLAEDLTQDTFYKTHITLLTNTAQVIKPCLLLILNIMLLTNMDITNNHLYLLIYLTAPFSVISIFSKKSRSLGLWGLSIVLFMMIFTVTIFLLGWMVIPFP